MLQVFAKIVEIYRSFLLAHCGIILYERLATAPMESVSGELLVALEVAPFDAPLWSIYPYTIWGVDTLLLLIPIEKVGVKVRTDAIAYVDLSM